MMREDFGDAINSIIEGAKLHHLGRFLQQRKLQLMGLHKTDKGIKIIDEECPQARDILIPLLEHEDPSVRVTAASALLLSRPALATPVLEDIRTNCTTIAQQSASTIIAFQKTFGFPIGGLCRSDPRYPVPEHLVYKGVSLEP